jgi:hypothetical protein
MRKPDIDLHVERLVLHDVAAGDRHHVGAAAIAELTRLLAAHGISPALARGGDLDSIGAGAFRLLPTARPSAIGIQVARSVHQALIR